MKYRVSMHVTGYYKPSITDAELNAIANSHYDTSLIYQIGEDYFTEADFGELEDIEFNSAAFFKEDEEISMRIEGYFRLYLEAEDAKEAEEKANDAWTEADFGELEDIEYNKIIARCIL